MTVNLIRPFSTETVAHYAAHVEVKAVSFSSRKTANDMVPHKFVLLFAVSKAVAGASHSV